jgi:hypothetical protein
MTRLAWLAGLVSLAACAVTTAPPERARLTTLLRVDNHGSDDVVVYLADGHTPRRLGQVAGLDRALFAIPNQLAADGVRLLVRRAGVVHTTDLLAPGAGAVLELTVQPLLMASDVSVLSYGPPVR